MINWTIQHLPTIDSTNTYAKKLIQENKATHGLVIQADEQTKGRGRQGRVWESPKGNLYTSIIIKIPQAPLTHLTFACTVGICKALETEGFHPQCKWPNDVMIGKKKTAGMLIEKEGDFLIIGIGMNLNKAPKLTTATALSAHGKIDITKILKTLLKQLEQAWQILEKKGFKEIRTQWLDRAIGLKESITIIQGEKKKIGLFKQIDEKGALILEHPNKTTEQIFAGDLFLN